MSLWDVPSPGAQNTSVEEAWELEAQITLTPTLGLSREKEVPQGIVSVMESQVSPLFAIVSAGVACWFAIFELLVARG